LLDEIDRYPASAGTEGDPCALAEKRAETFYNAVVIKTSTPTVRGSSRIDVEYEASDQRQWFCPCPRCQTHQLLKWSQVQWPQDDPAGAWYQCEACNAQLTDAERLAMVKAGEWRATYPARAMRGYHLNGIASVFRARRGYRTRLHQMAAEFLKAKAGGIQTMRVWTNTFLAESYQEDAERVAASDLEKRAETYGATLPNGVLLLTAGVDVQVDRLVLEAVGWGDGEESWGAAFKTIPGRPDDPKTWKRLDLELQKTWKREDGAELRLVAVGVDYNAWPDYVLKWTRTRFARGILAVKGSSQAGAPIVSAVRRSNRYKAAALSVGTDAAKSLIYARLKLKEAGAGAMHFPDATQGYDGEFYSQLTAEELRISFRRGFAVREWHKIRRRNEALDIRVYGLAMLRWLNPDWLSVAKSQGRKGTEVPADPTKAGTINPDPGPVAKLAMVKPKAPPARPAKLGGLPGRGWAKAWRRF
jgi:phage terminase large subunit GpA-like protein